MSKHKKHITHNNNNDDDHDEAEATEIAQWLRVIAANVEELVLVLCTTLYNASPEDLTNSFGLRGHCTDLHAGKSYTHRK